MKYMYQRENGFRRRFRIRPSRGFCGVGGHSDIINRGFIVELRGWGGIFSPLWDQIGLAQTMEEAHKIIDDWSHVTYITVDDKATP